MTGRPAPAGASTSERPAELRQRGGAAARGLRAAALFLAGQAVLTAVLRAWQPRFFYLDDKQAQYLPVWHWLGQRASWTGVPPVDPDQGSGGAFVADLQYGVLDPFHWALARVVTSVDDLNLLGWGLHLLAVVVLGLGVVVLATHLRVGTGWAAAAALAAANSGFLLWFAASWWPASWGTALLPWLWWSLSSRSRWALPAATVSAYLLTTSGYPYTLPFAAVVVVGVVLERVLGASSWRAVVGPHLAPRLLAGAGGLLLGSPGLIAASAMTPYSARAGYAPAPLGNGGDFIPNLLDVLVGGATTSPQVTGWWGVLAPVAIMATGWFVLPVLALVRWSRTALTDRGAWSWGLLTAVLLVGASALATQTPTEVASLRFPFRYAVVLQVFAPLAVALLARSAGLSSSRRRVVLAVALVLAQAVLGLLRTPALVEWHLLAGLGGAAAVVVVVALLRSVTPGARTAAAVVAVAACVAAPLLSVATSVSLGAHLARAAGTAPSDEPARGMYNVPIWPATVSEFRSSAWEPDLNATVVVWGGAGLDRNFGRGLPLGSANLFSGTRGGTGYSSLGQGGWQERWCQDYLGQSAQCGDAVDRLLATTPGTDQSWLETTSKDVLLLDERTPPEIAESLDDRWTRVEERRGFVRYERTTPTSGRITWTSDAVRSVTALEVEEDHEAYRVAWEGGPARLVTRIPWWPGYSASLDGEELPVEVVDATVVAVDLPAGGGEGVVEIDFTPPRALERTAALVLGALLTAVGVATGLRRRAR